MEFKQIYFAYFATFIISILVMNTNIFMKKMCRKSSSYTLKNANVWLNVSSVKLKFMNNW